MATLLLASTPVPGHVMPMGVLARALVERGHDVGWYTGAGFADAVTATGAHHFPIQHEFDWSLRHIHDAVPELREVTGVAQVRLAFTRMVDGAVSTLADLERIVTDFPAEVVIANTLVIADTWLRERGGPVNARLSTTMLGLYSRDTAPVGLGKPPSATLLGHVRNRVMNAAHRRIVFGPVSRHLDDVRESIGLPRQRRAIVDAFISPYLWLQDTVPSFEYPRSDLPPQVHFIGPLLPQVPADFVEPEWWKEVTGPRPVVLVTQGTLRNENAALIGPAIEALAGMDVQVVIATGGGTVRLPDALPPRVRVVDHVPFAALMPRVSVYVTNGGYGGVQMALAHGVPMVVVGATEDKPEVGARVAWSGAGIRVAGEPTARSIGDSVSRVLEDPSYRTSATRIAAEIATYDAGDLGASLVEELARTQRPVPRGRGALPETQPRL